MFCTFLCNIEKPLATDLVECYLLFVPTTNNASQGRAVNKPTSARGLCAWDCFSVRVIAHVIMWFIPFPGCPRPCQHSRDGSAQYLNDWYTYSSVASVSSECFSLVISVKTYGIGASSESLPLCLQLAKLTHFSTVFFVR